jgi:hypothetical protein
MNVWNKLRSLFIKPQPPSKLRNKAGGMAWIKASIDQQDGAIAIAGSAVRTVGLDKCGMWLIEPQVSYVATANVHFVVQDKRVRKGDVVTVMSIADDCLEPWREDDNTQESEERSFQPPVPKREILALPVKEM